MAHPLQPGDVVGERYRIERVLGEGGMGVVLSAQHLVLGERVALKMLLPEAAKVPGVVPRFQREARAASRIQSEHVARVMDVGLLPDGAPYLVMEYVEGQDLSAELEARGPLPVEEAVGYVLQAAVGVAAAHALGIVHRDLKPSNLFLARLANGRTLIKVLDFGIAKDMADIDSKDLTSTFSALGSAAYMSPEQVRLAKSVDARTDVWAFGVVLFELLTQRLPFDGESVTAIAAAITVDAPVSLRSLRPDVPADVESAVLGCLEKNRDQRTPTLAALAKALAPFGGRYASVLAGRIAETLGAPRPSEMPPQDPASMPTPSPASRKISEGTAPGAETRARSTSEGADRRVILLSTVGAALLGAGALLWVAAGRSGEPAPRAAGSAAPLADSTSSAASRASAAPLDPPPDVQPAQVPAASSVPRPAFPASKPTASEAKPSPKTSGAVGPPGAKASGGTAVKNKPRKPFVTDL